MIHRALSEARNATNVCYIVGMAIRPRGVAFSMPDRRSSVSQAVMSVIVAPALIASFDDRPAAIDTGGPMGKMVLTVLGMVAEMELSFLKERQRAGIEAARAKGVYKGRPPTFDHAKIVALRKQGKGATEIARAVGCQRGNVYKALKASGSAS